MKSVVRSLLLPLLFSCVVDGVHAQIRDDESSQSVLAVQCAVSSGFSASEFEDYSRRLAKTLSLLTSNQQRKVFGYLPQPALASSNEAVASSPVLSADQSVVKNADPELLVGLVGNLNNALSGVSTAPSAVYEEKKTESVGSVVSAIAKGDTEKNLEQAATSIAGKKGNSTWNAVLSWLSSLAAKARYR